MKILTMPGSGASQPSPNMKRLRRNLRTAADPFAILVDEADDEPVQANMIRQRMRTVARQAALDPGDGLDV